MDNYMKIYIDPDEPLNSFLDKVKLAKEDKIIVIAHRKSPIFSGQVNIELIKKYAKQSDKKLIFISNSKKTKTILSKVGFEVYTKLEDFERQTDGISLQNAERESLLTLEEYSAAKRKSKRRSKVRWILASATVLLLLIIWVYFAFPVITVEIEPTIKDRTLVSQVKAVENLATIDWVNNSLPLIKKEVELEEQLSFQTTGSKEIGIRKSSGVLTLINSNKKNIIIAAGTKVSTRNGVKFRTQEKVVVPASKVEKFMDVVVGLEAGKAEVNIEAIYNGVHGNVSKGRIVDFVTKNYPVQIVNPEATYGGQNKIVKVVSQADIDNSLKQAKDRLLKQAKEELNSKFDSTLIFFRDESQLELPTFNCKNNVGDITEQLLITGQVKITGFAIEKEGLKSLVFKLYKDSLEDKFVLNKAQITIKEVDIAQLKDNQIDFRVKSLGQVAGRINKDEVINQLLGKKVEEARGLLDKMLEIDSYQFKPVNQVNLPQFKYGINLVVRDGNAYGN